jgi:hypothetical protein
MYVQTFKVRNFVDEIEAVRVAEMQSTVVALLATAVSGDAASTGASLPAATRCVALHPSKDGGVGGEGGTGAGEWVGRCGCSVSQCVAGSLVADSMQHASEADFAVSTSSGIRAGLNTPVTKAAVHAMLPEMRLLVTVLASGLYGVPLSLSLSCSQHPLATA